MGFRLDVNRALGWKKWLTGRVSGEGALPCPPPDLVYHPRWCLHCQVILLITPGSWPTGPAPDMMFVTDLHLLQSWHLSSRKLSIFSRPIWSRMSFVWHYLKPTNYVLLKRNTKCVIQRTCALEISNLCTWRLIDLWTTVIKISSNNTVSSVQSCQEYKMYFRFWYSCSITYHFGAINYKSLENT